jgi:hypothetical protein
MDLKIRLSDALEARLRAHAENTGATMNSIIALAIDAFLPGLIRVQEVAPVAQPIAVPGNVIKRSAVVAKRPIALKPKLGPKPTKAQRTALAEWHRANGSDQGELLSDS